MKNLLRAIAGVFLLGLLGGLIFLRYPLWINDQQIRFHLWQNNVRSEFIVVGSDRLHYFEAFPQDGREGTPLLLIHGLGARGEDWAGLMPGLAAAGFHVYAPDLLGYGRSPRPDISYSIQEEENAVLGFMRAINLGRTDVGGWSMGGWIALKLTLDHPELVHRLVVYDSAGVYFPASEDADLFTPTDPAGVRRLMTVLSPRPVNMPDFVAHDVMRKVERNAWVIHRSMAQMMSGRDLLDFRLYRIRRPTLVMWGSRDELIPLAAGERMHELIPGSTLDVVDGCGHLAPSECWRPVLKSTVEFLRAEPTMLGGKRLIPGSEAGQ
jgi:pimeloyl-ACP methyl ester carboxylesterase